MKIKKGKSRVKTAVLCVIATICLGGIIVSGAQIDLNGPEGRTATEATPSELPDGPSVVPGHEPWDRPDSPGDRGPNWKA